MCTQAYLIDTYMMYAASALAANTIVRSAVGAAFPLFTVQMFDNVSASAPPISQPTLTIVLVPLDLTAGDQLGVHAHWSHHAADGADPLPLLPLRRAHPPAQRVRAVSGASVSMRAACPSELRVVLC